MTRLLLCALALTSCIGCASAGQLNPNTACKLGALTTLPDDPEAVSVRDVVRIVRAVHACDEISREYPDGGTP